MKFTRKLKDFLVTILLLTCIVTTLNIESIAAKSVISLDTVITQENIDDVLNYLNIDKSSVENNNSIEKNVNKVCTVRELKMAITMNKQRQNNQNAMYQSCKVNTLDTRQSNNSTAKAKSSQVNLEMTNHIGSYDVIVKVKATFKNGSYTGVDSPKATADTDAAIGTYKVVKNGLSSTYTATKVTVSGNVTVREYLSIGDFKIISLGDNEIKIKNYWYANK